MRAFFGVTFIALLLMPLVASADDAIWCEGTIGGVFVTGDGSVQVSPSWRNDWVQVCSLEANYKGGVTPKVCSAWLASLLLANETQQRTTIRYDGQGSMTCATVPNYGGAPPPSYVMLVQ
jgi:hypothetical protein